MVVPNLEKYQNATLKSPPKIPCLTVKLEVTAIYAHDRYIDHSPIYASSHLVFASLQISPSFLYP